MVTSKNNYIAALDIGTTKIACYIAEIDGKDNIKIIGASYQESKGVKAGIITDIAEVGKAVLNAITIAEQEAAVNIESVIVNLSGNKQKSHLLNVAIPLNPGQEITLKDIHRVIEEGSRHINSENIDIVHCIALEYIIDNNKGIIDPKGMFGKNLGVNLHIVTACSTSIVNLTTCLANCHLDVEHYVSASYASSYACLTEDEKKLGTILIEFGGGTTSLTAFKDGNMIYSYSLAIGGMHITNDIALIISTNLVAAERLKILHGSLLPAGGENDDMIEVEQIGQNGEIEIHHITYAELSNIIRSRVEEIIEIIKDQIDNSSLSQTAANIVITGGAGKLLGLKEFVATHLNRNVRVAGPVTQNITGITDQIKNPAFSSCIGMLKYYCNKQYHDEMEFLENNKGINKYFNRMIRWVKENI